MEQIRTIEDDFFQIFQSINFVGCKLKVFFGDDQP